MACEERYVHGEQLFGVRAVAVRAHVNDRNLDTGLLSLDGRGQRHVVVDDKQPAMAGLHAVALQVSLNRAGEHHAGHVIVAEHQRTLECTRGQHNLLCADPVPAHARAVWVGVWLVEVIGHPLQRRQHVVIKDAGQRGPGHDAYVRIGLQLRLNRGDPEIRVHTVDLNRVAQQ